MSDANLTAIRVSGEVSPKVLATNPLFQQIRITGASLAFNPETSTSNELDSTRQVTDLVLVGFSSSGEVPTEMVIDNLDPLYESGFFNPWNRAPEVINGNAWEYGWASAATTRISSVTSTTITLAATSVLAGTSVNLTGTQFKVGHLVRLTDFGVPEQILRISASTATALTVAGATAVGSPPAGAKVKVVGFEGVAGDIAATVTSGNALTSTTLDFTTLGLSPNQWVKIGEGAPAAATAFGTAALSGYAKISTISANRLSFSIVPLGWVADAGTGKTIRVFFGDTIANGITAKTFTIEQSFVLSSGARYLYHLGQQVSSIAINADAKATITQSLSFQGLTADPISASRKAGAVTVPPVIGVPMNSSTAIPVFLEGGSPVTDPNFVSSFSLTLDNTLRPRDAIGVLGAASVGAGRFNVTGSLNTYFGDETLYNKIIGNVITSLTMAFRDHENFKGEIWDIPRVKYSSGAPDVTGVDTDVFVPLNFQAMGDPSGVIPYTVQLNRFAYLPA